MTVTVVLPWRGGCAHRTRALGWVMSRYAQHHPNWPVFVATAPDESGPWSKARAAMPAIEAADDGIVVLADADVWTDGLADAVAAVESGAYGWAVPHRLVWRLTEGGTDAVLAGADWRGQRLAQRQYPGVLGGGIVVASRETLLTAPLDPRFEGFGQEDQSLALALDTLGGDMWRGDADLVHCWHPPQDRMDRKYGSPRSAGLHDRYRQASGDPAAMRELIAEASPGFVAVA